MQIKHNSIIALQNATPRGLSKLFPHSYPQYLWITRKIACQPTDILYSELKILMSTMEWSKFNTGCLCISLDSICVFSIHGPEQTQDERLCWVVYLNGKVNALFHAHYPVTHRASIVIQSKNKNICLSCCFTCIFWHGQIKYNLTIALHNATCGFLYALHPQAYPQYLWISWLAGDDYWPGTSGPTTW